jgi:DNA gyrase subunit A
MVTRNGMCIRFKDKDIRSTGRNSMGVIGMNLEQGDEIVGMQMNTQGSQLLIVTENGMGKRTDIDEFHTQRRGGKGLKCYKITEKTGRVAGVKAVNDDHEVMLITNEGIIIQLRCDEISTYSRITSGVKLINLDDGVIVAKIAKVRQTEGVISEDSEGKISEKISKEISEKLPEDESEETTEE